MADAALNLLNDPPELARRGSVARRLAEGELSWAQQIKKLENFYHAILRPDRHAKDVLVPVQTHFA